MNYYRLSNGGVTATIGELEAEQITKEEFDSVMIASVETMAKKEVALSRIMELKQKLFDTDYQAIKYSEGLISEVEYAPIKEQRQEWRDEINRIEQDGDI